MRVSEDKFYCHRCKRGGTTRSLARELGHSVTPETAQERSAREQKAKFKSWINERHNSIAAELRVTRKRADIAKRVLRVYPDCEPAWDALARFCHSEAKLTAALETLSFEKVPTYLEEPSTPDTLFAEFKEIHGSR